MSVLNPRTRRDLELDKVLEIVASYAASELGREAIASLEPSANRDHIAREFSLVEEMLEAVRGGFSPGPISDLRPLIDKAKDRGDLTGEEFLRIAETVEVTDEREHFCRTTSTLLCSTRTINKPLSSSK